MEPTVPRPGLTAGPLLLRLTGYSGTRALGARSSRNVRLLCLSKGRWSRYRQHERDSIHNPPHWIPPPIQSSRKPLLNDIPKPTRQWPKNNHNRIITGIGTPSSHSRSPRPIVSPPAKAPLLGMQKGMSGSCKRLQYRPSPQQQAKPAR